MLYVISLWICFACEKAEKTDPIVQNSVRSSNSPIVSQLLSNYSTLPEKAISVNLDSTIFAQYSMPTTKYTHGILGDKIEAEQLVVAVDSMIYSYILPDEFVFEDIRPRLYDVDGDNQLEFITIRSHRSKGAGIAIYKVQNDKLVEYASVAEIGRSNRWLNIVAINDLDNDGTVEIAWIQTPHIGGILKVAKIKAGSLEVLSSTSQYSNHAIGERNLCLSTMVIASGQKLVYVPTQDRTKIVGFALEDNQWKQKDEIELTVVFSEPLFTQFKFNNLIEDKINCINPSQ